MSDDRKVPYGFVFNRPKKPKHTETITLRGHVVTCACGEPWFAATEALGTGENKAHRLQPLAGQKCPTCGAGPKPGTISAPEEMSVDVPLVFGRQPLLPVPTDGAAIVKPPRR